MPRIQLQDPNGQTYALHTTDPAKIGPWIAEWLPVVSWEYAPPPTIQVYPLPDPRTGEPDWPPQDLAIWHLDDQARKRLVEDLAAVLGLELRGQLVKAEGPP
jgi:hypothetical protein